MFPWNSAVNVPKGGERVELVEKFFKLMTERLAWGEKEYGDKTFNGSLLNVLGMMQEEFLDVGNYAFMAYAKIDRLKGLVWQIENDKMLREEYATKEWSGD